MVSATYSQVSVFFTAALQAQSKITEIVGLEWAEFFVQGQLFNMYAFQLHIE